MLLSQRRVMEAEDAGAVITRHALEHEGSLAAAALELFATAFGRKPRTSP